jgi:hypothetical protein
MKLLLNLFCLSLLSFSCKKEKKEDNVLLPSNLKVNYEVVGGLVNVTVEADNANFYTIIFYDKSDTIFVKADNGKANHTYTSSGTYKITTRANATHEKYIEDSKSLAIYVEESVTGVPPTEGFISPLSYPGYSLVWNDEFDGNELSAAWVHDIGTGNNGWGNSELQYYTNENHTVSNGYLQIKAKAETFNNSAYTSSRIKTQNTLSWKYGRIDVRAAVPYGKGLWPAIWMLGDNITSVGWPACGEIDIMELVGGAGLNDRTIHGTAHWSDGSHAQFGKSYSLPSGKFADKFHVFSIIWDQNSIKWLVDNVQYSELSTTPAQMSEFREKFFLIFNVAVGGQWPGNPDPVNTIFPQSMFVDYVRVFQ